MVSSIESRLATRLPDRFENAILGVASFLNVVVQDST
jgi:hypothetical protein